MVFQDITGRSSCDAFWAGSMRKHFDFETWFLLRFCMHAFLDRGREEEGRTKEGLGHGLVWWWWWTLPASLVLLCSINIL